MKTPSTSQTSSPQQATSCSQTRNLHRATTRTWMRGGSWRKKHVAEDFGHLRVVTRARARDVGFSLEKGRGFVFLERGARRASNIESWTQHAEDAARPVTGRPNALWTRAQVHLRPPLLIPLLHLVKDHPHQAIGRMFVQQTSIMWIRCHWSFWTLMLCSYQA